jgi:hypothetical protein
VIQKYWGVKIKVNALAVLALVKTPCTIAGK